MNNQFKIGDTVKIKDGLDYREWFKGGELVVWSYLDAKSGSGHVYELISKTDGEKIMQLVHGDYLELCPEDSTIKSEQKKFEEFYNDNLND